MQQGGGQRLYEMLVILRVCYLQEAEDPIVLQIKIPFPCHFLISQKGVTYSPHRVFVWQETPNSETFPARGYVFLSSE